MKACFLLLLITLLRVYNVAAQLTWLPGKSFDPDDAPVIWASPHYVSYLDCTYKQLLKDSKQPLKDSSRMWTAPKNTITDWASIPKLCVPIIGFPDDERWNKAALIHDAYCGDDNVHGASYHKAPWQEVHRMFRDACLSGGTPKTKANIMFAAVYLYGTRNKWVFDNGSPRTIKYEDGQKSGATAEEKKAANLDLTMIPESSQIQQMAEIGRFVEARAHASKGVIDEPYKKTLDSVAHESHENRLVPAPTIATYYSFFAKEKPQPLVPSKDFLSWKEKYLFEVAQYEHSYASSLKQEYVVEAQNEDKKYDLSTAEGLQKATEARKKLRKLYEIGPQMPGKPALKAAIKADLKAAPKAAGPIKRKKGK
ncbi:DUF1353 domain-containing protein [Hymenobacter ruricola]|uniref:DUF1353 domain-containing protein n=1 Tax=Hymenobacter ruricola TaxID=2791023 RepID=A0ABS0I7P9_9BACT|nr:DUF1353 domain-containing protein [Hymenobacter ruricola]MBF9223002.1 DUF1353 domain-containing protein [Hymenobacter ruricola]